MALLFWPALPRGLPRQRRIRWIDARFARLWPSDHPRRPWVHRELLRWRRRWPFRKWPATSLPTLDAPQPDLRILAVNALAVATGRDLRRDAAGTLRPLDAVVADYKTMLRPH